MRTAWFLIVAVLCAVPSPEAQTQGYPSRPIRLVVPFPPGGGVDILARVVAARVYEPFGQTVVVDNRPGAGSAIGIETVVRAIPDGYTMGMLNSSYTTVAALQKLTYDPVNDFQPIIMIGETGLVIATLPSMPVRSVQELISYARTNSGKLNYSSVGTGSLTHLALELFKLEAKIDIVHVPYKGGAPALNAVIGGEVQLTAVSTVPTLPHVKAGRVRALAVTTSRRMQLLPDLPAVAETVPGYEVIHWYGIFGPKGLPKPVVGLWNREVAKLLQAEEMKNRMAAEALEPAGTAPEVLLQTIRRDVEKWRRVVREMKITAN